MADAPGHFQAERFGNAPDSQTGDLQQMNGFTRRFFPTLTALMMVFWLSACAGESSAEGEGHEGEGEHAAMESGEGGGEHNEGGEAREGGEHNEGGEAREGGEHNEGGEGSEHGGEAHDESGEESGVYIAKADSWDVVRRGARLVLSFDAAADAFVGTVENTTENKLCAIRVEVHIDSGTELGPTPRVDLPAGQTTNVILATEGEAFESFTAHPEMSPCGNS